jgi:hypothetical protein
MKNKEEDIPQESKNLRVGLFLAGVLLIGFALGAFAIAYENNEQIEELKKIVEITPEKVDCPGLNSEDVKNIMYREIENVIETRAILDGAMGEPTFVPMLKNITSPDYQKEYDK